VTTTAVTKNKKKKEKKGEGETVVFAPVTVEKRKRTVDDGFGDSRGKSSKYTEDGLRIYSVQDLNIGLGGDTPQCPFDCDCCF
jgi:hypothetical protein